jgi:structural maintenance of chromosomes protein 6
MFTTLLSMRGFQGRLILDHTKGELRVKVNPGGKGTRKDPKSLSGGEKSFAQICMLLAVWEAMGSPLRALDELCPPYPLFQWVLMLVTFTWML